MKKYCVYLHTNKINGKKYVGQTCLKPERRWNNGKGYKSCILFDKAIKKYGWDNFEHSVLYADLSCEEANKIECELIDTFKTCDPSFGYNIMIGGSHSALSEETKKKLSEARKGMIPWNKGLHLSEETKQKISSSEKGRKTWNKGIKGVIKQSSETKAKHKKRMEGCKWWNNGIINKFAKECPGEDFVKGRLLSEDFRKKLSQVNKNKIPWNKKVKGE